MALDMGTTIQIIGSYTGTNVTNMVMNGTFAFTQTIGDNEPLPKYHYIMDGCYRESSWPLLFHPLNDWWDLLLTPVFVGCLAALNGQGWRDWRRLALMTLFGCSSFAANFFFNKWIYDQNDVVSAIGATVVGILGAARGSSSPGDKLPSMIPGILVLLPVRIFFFFSEKKKKNPIEIELMDCN